MATVPSRPILIWTPGGGVPVGPVSNPPVYSQAGTTPLIEGQAYVDVVFGSTQTTDEWVLVECVVVNEIDVEPLNIWPGIITDKTVNGFRIYLNGFADSGNYYLHWAVSGINIAPTPATTYILSGPASGTVSVPATFTVHLPSNSTVPAPVTVTPSDGGGGGAFSPTSVTLSTGASSTTFTYTPGTAGTKTISVTNSGTLANPASISFVAIVYATGYSMSGPSTGSTGVPSSAFTVTLTPPGNPVPATVTVTPSDGGGGGTFTPTTVNLTTVAPSATFTYTAASVGAKTISATNNGGLTNPANLTYTASVPPAVLTDNFTGTGLISAHAADTGQTWQNFVFGNPTTVQVGSGSAYGNAVGGEEDASSYTPASPDQEASIVVIKGAITGSPEVGIWLRGTVSAANPRGYLGRFVEGSGWQFYRVDTGNTFVQVGVTTAGTLANGDTIRFTVSGTGATVTLTLYKNGGLQYQTTDASANRIVTTGNVGIHLFDPSTGAGNYRIDQITAP